MSSSIVDKKIINIKEVNEALIKLKRKHVRYTNFFFNQEEILSWIQDGCLNIAYSDKSVLLLRKRKKFTTIYFLTCDAIDFDSLLQGVICNSCNIYVTNVFYRRGLMPDIVNVLKNKGFIIRCTNKRLVLKNKTYIATSNFSYNLISASLTDTEEIYNMFLENFDEFSDRLPTKQDIAKAIENKNIDIVLFKPLGTKTLVSVSWFVKKGHTILWQYYVISSACQGIGLGKKLACQVLKNYINERIVLWCGDDNIPAISLHASLGFVEDFACDTTLCFFPT